MTLTREIKEICKGFGEQGKARPNSVVCQARVDACLQPAYTAPALTELSRPNFNADRVECKSS